MKYIKLFEEFSGLDPIEVLPDGILLQRWSNITWFSLDQGQIDKSHDVPTSLDEIVIILGSDDVEDKETWYVGYVATDQESKDPLAIYASIRIEEDKGTRVVARVKVDSFESGVSQLIAWTDMPGHEITHAKVDQTRKVDVSDHIAKSAPSLLDISGGISNPKMRKIGPNKSGTISKFPINPN